MVLVRGNDPYVGVEFAQQTVNWETAATTGWQSCPLLSESLTLEREQLPVPKELGGSGYREFFEYGRKFVRGTLTVLPRYDSKFIHQLFAHAMYSETVVPDTYVNGFALNGGGGANPPGNTHLYQFSATLPKGLTIRVHKGGQSLGKYDEFVGCMVTQLTIEQPENDVMRCTFTFLGYNLTTTSQSGALSAIGGVVPVRIRDYGNTYGYVKTGATLTALNVKGFRINIDRKLELDTAFLNNLDSVAQPGITDVREVTCELQGSLEQSYGDANRPHTEYLAKTNSKADIMIAADESVTANLLYNSGGAASRPYAMRFEFPSIYWTRVPDSVQSGGANDVTYAFTAIKGTMDSTGSLPDSVSSDFRILASVKDTDEPTPDAKFSIL